MRSMNAREAEQLLDGAEVVPVLQVTIPQGKEILAECLEAGIPVLLAGGSGCCETGGCSPRVMLYAREEDLPQLKSLLEQRWRALLAQEGTVRRAASAPGDSEAAGDPPCPACGTAPPLVEGACSDCGLQLA